jgi:thymidylate kinase
MLIILEGPNGSGKTSVRDALIVKTGCTRIYHRDPPEPGRSALIDHTADLQLYDPDSGEVIICDRWHLSEAVYGRLDRDGCGLSPMEWATVEAFLARLKAVVVFCTADVETLLHRLLIKGEDAKIERCQQEFDLYEEAPGWTNLPVAVVDTTTMSPDDIAARIVDWIGSLESK